MLHGQRQTMSDTVLNASPHSQSILTKPVRWQKWYWERVINLGKVKQLKPGFELKSSQIQSLLHYITARDCVLSEFICWISKVMVISMWGHLELFRSWGRALMNGINCSYEEDSRALPHLFCYLWTQWGDGHLWTRKWVLTRHWKLPALWPRLPSLKDSE